jgi:hypothetical protein
MVLNLTLLKESGKSMAYQEYWLVDEEGNRIENYVFDPDFETIPENCFPTWTTPMSDAKWDFEKGEWVEGTPYEELLSMAKNLKDGELSRACSETILAGFDYAIDDVVYHFSFDTEAQLNFQGTERILEQGLIETISWTVTREGQYERITINKTLMDELKIAILIHKDANIAKYRDVLMPMVNAATTVEEVKAIQWDDVPPTPSVKTPQETPEEPVEGEVPAPSEPTPSDSGEGATGEGTL